MIFFDAALGYYRLQRALRAAAVHWLGGLLNPLGRAAGTGKQQARMTVFLPQCTQRLTGQIRQRHEAVLVALTAPNVYASACRVDVTDLQCQGLAEAQPHRIGGQQEDAVAQSVARPDHLLHFGEGQNIG